MSDEGFVDPSEITTAIQEIVRAWGDAQNRWLMKRTAAGALDNGLVERVAIYSAARLYARAFRLDEILPAEELAGLEEFLASCSVKTGTLEDMGAAATQKVGRA